MDGRLTRTNCDEAGDYVVPNVLSARDLVSRPDNWTKLYYHHTTFEKETKAKSVQRTILAKTRRDRFKI